MNLYALPKITVIGGGLSGCEAALNLLAAGFAVDMYEMRPKRPTEAHTGGGLAELVCSNSLKSESQETASGVLKEELDALGCRLLKIARQCRVPSGSALSVDREKFSNAVQRALEEYPLFRLVREEATDWGEEPTIIATGPLTSSALAQRLTEVTGRDRLFFYDAVSPIIDFESIDMTKAYFGGRYGKDGDDYLNLPMEREEYDAFYEALCGAETVVLKSFEKSELFEGCMPIEEIARRGRDTMRFGPLRPVGLRNPASGKGAYAVVQLRKENVEGDCYNLVGFQTNLTFPEQRRVFRMLPALNNAEFMRYGVMHRNTYINSPGLLSSGFRLGGSAPVYIAGQLSGVEGYMESIMSGLVAAVNLERELKGMSAAYPPATTIMGALCRYVSEPKEHFQPMNANFGLLPFGAEATKKERKKYYRDRAISDIICFKQTLMPQ